MSDELFKSGGPHRIKKTGLHRHEFSIDLPTDEDGRVARECPVKDCSPGAFKVTAGTGTADKKEISYCPYCRISGAPVSFTAADQKRYGRDIVAVEAEEAIKRRLAQSLGLNKRGRSGGGMLNLTMEFKPSPRRRVRRPFAEVLRRDVVCPKCSFDHSVYGLATWCPGCGCDIFTTHVQAEIDVVKTVLTDMTRREKEFGIRIATSDLENALEDLVSILEATLKYEIRRHARDAGESEEQLEKRMKKIGSRLQSVRNAEDLLPKHCGVKLDQIAATRIEQLDLLFQKRHPITHNLGVIDRKYLERIRSSEAEGREVRISREELEAAAKSVFELLEGFHLSLFPDAICAKDCSGHGDRNMGESDDPDL